MSEKIKIIIDEDNDGDRLDTAVSDNIENISRARCQKLIKEGAVWLNGKIEKASKTVREGDVAEVLIPELKPAELLPQD